MKSHDKNDMVKALTSRGVNLSDKSFLLVAFFLFFLIAIPFHCYRHLGKEEYSIYDRIRELNHRKTKDE